MSVFNASQFLEQTIISVLKQTYNDFQFILINDGSTDNSFDIIRAFDDKRIKIIENDVNKGNSYSLNKGILSADSEYIVRVDSDDICVEDRIEKQVRYMDENISLGLSGCWFKEFGDGDRLYTHSTIPEELNTQLLFFNPIGHPTVIFRRLSLTNNKLFYDERFKFCEDYDLWSRCKHVFKLGNLDEILVNYRRHPNQISTKDLKAQRSESLDVKCKQMKELKPL